MAQSVGVHSKGSGGALSTATTAGVNTTGGAGSSFLLGMVWYGSASAPVSVTDNVTPTPNTWTAVGSSIPFTLDNVGKFQVYKKLGGIGKTGHTVTADFSGGASGGLSIFFIEGLGFSSPFVDQFTGAADVTNPFSSGSITTTAPNAMLFGFTGTYQNALESRSWSGFTEVETYGDGSLDFTGGVAYQIVTATGTYAASFTDSATGGNTVSDEAVTWIVAVADTPVAASNIGKIPTRQLLDGTLPHLRMSPESEHRAQKLLRAQKRAYGFPAHAP